MDDRDMSTEGEMASRGKEFTTPQQCLKIYGRGVLLHSFNMLIEALFLKSSGLISLERNILDKVEMERDTP